MVMRRLALRRSLATVLVLILCSLASSAFALSDRTIGVYFDANGTQCNGTIVPGTPGTIYILTREEPGAPGFVGFEFRFGGLPASWTVFPVPNSDMLTMGDPFAGGVFGAFSTCQMPDDGIVKLYTVLVLATAQESDVNFTIERRNPPSNPNFQCPVLTNCDVPFYSAVCVDGIRCFVNASRSQLCAYPTAVEAASWSTLKQFYR
jgi:hypothetical protein